MTTVNFNLSIDDEKILGNIIKSNGEINTLEEAILWCIRNYNNILISQAIKSALIISQNPQAVQVFNVTDAVSKISYFPEIETRPAPAAVTEKILLLTGATSNIDNLINRIQKDIPQYPLNLSDLE